MVAAVTDATFAEETKDGLVLIDFWATWCGPCRAFGPIFEQVSEKFDDVPFVKVDIDQSPDLASAAAIKAVPTVMVIKRGDVIYRQAGALLPADLGDLVNQAKAYNPSKDDEGNSVSESSESENDGE